MQTQSADVIIIGGGPGGYVAAIKAAQLGLTVVCIEKRKTLGGTCLNEGCIPSKALLTSSYKYYEAKEHFKEHGIHLKDLHIDVDQFLKRKDKVVNDLTKGIDFLFKKNKVTRVEGTATFVDANQVRVTKPDGQEDLWQAAHIVIATGSVSTQLSHIAVDEEHIVSSTGALCLDKVPDHLVVVGGGYIGLEMGSVWKRLGSKVTVVEYLPTIVPMMDQEVAQTLKKSLEKQGIEFSLGQEVMDVEKKKKHLTLHMKNVTTQEKTALECDVLLLSIGRKPYTEGLGLETIGVHCDQRGFIQVDQHYRTSVSGIYAIGDVIPGPMLAHKAEEEGVAVVELIAGQSGHVNYNVIPSVIYTHPEVASVGLTEQNLKEQGIAYKVGKFSFMANSRAKAQGDDEGFVKLLTDATTDTILGAHIIGPDAGTMISEISVAMEFGGAAEDIARTCHPHPTLSEAVKEAGLAAFSKALHL